MADKLAPGMKLPGGTSNQAQGQASKNGKGGRQPFIKKKKAEKIHIIVLVVSILVIIVTAFRTYSTISAQNAKLASNQGILSDVRGEISVLNSQMELRDNSPVKKDYNYDPVRFERDQAIILEFLDSVLTWDSYNEYLQKHDMVLRECKIEDDSDFMKIFFPDLTLGSDGNGNRYNAVDSSGLRATRDGFSCYLCSVKGSSCSYFCVLEWSVSGAGYSNVGRTGIMCTINEDGSIYNDLTAFMVEY